MAVEDVEEAVGEAPEKEEDGDCGMLVGGGNGGYGWRTEKIGDDRLAES